MKRWHKFVAILMIILAIGAGITLFINMHDSENIGSNNLGYVTKDTYSHYGNSDKKIAIVSGMHARETLSANVLPEVAKIYAFFNNVEVVNYKVTVLANPENFAVGRANGETLVHDFVVKDIAKENYNLVIVGHDHEQGYGDGFYIATPSMDYKSINLAEKVMSDLPDFKYYKRDTESSAKSTSITRVDNPIVATGTPLFVYEIPEWLSFSEAFSKSYDLVSSSFKNF
ncbi:hypothetical protein KQY27_07980 [Methanobrevibacter sp. TMH8]|uniref:hypothetical protein n=1 Tax=Methanobrevibacter sp. TMH8 TaxID=2848611 RepID=UPI001CCA0BAA|nr:hypothetical protein [Methanobrevibacter sp. TMH8]MBZ9571484.1 hypothetical protein [Methanobrevibacter sp. TMH8]